jgi:hypothetical protein
MLAWLLVSCTAVAVGLMPFGYNFLATSFAMNNPSAMKALYYVVLVCGAYSLAMFGVAALDLCKKCSDKNGR